MSRSNNSGCIGDKIPARTSTGEMRASRFGHWHESLLFKNDFHFFTLHGRLPRDTLPRKHLPLDPDHNRAACLRLLIAPRNFPYCNSIAASRLRLRCMAFLAGLLANFFRKQMAKPGLGFM